jgi:adenylate cyclase
MRAGPIPQNEELRIAALRRYDLLDTDVDADLDEIVQIASLVCGKPIALVSLVDSNRQWFKSRVGLDATETPRDVAFCAHAIVDDSPVFEIPDALADPRFADNPLVTGGPRVRFYAGATLNSSDGFALGTLCVIDSEPARLTDEQRTVLGLLARRVETFLEQRIVLRQLARHTRHAVELEGILKTYTGREVWSQISDTISGEAPVVPAAGQDRTYVFADLNGFTELSARLDPLDLAAVLEERLGLAVSLVHEHHGDVEKFIGDCVFAVFDKASDAVDFAIDLQGRPSSSSLGGGQQVTFSIGIHSGYAQRLHIGSDDRRDNTLIGEAVNVAARLEAACPSHRTLISADTMRRAGRRGVGRSYELALKGLDEPLRVHELFQPVGAQFAGTSNVPSACLPVAGSQSPSLARRTA